MSGTLFKLPSKYIVWAICVFEYDTVIHRRTFIVVSCDINYHKINNLFFNWVTENPRVGSSILPLATMRTRVYSISYNKFTKVRKYHFGISSGPRTQNHKHITTTLMEDRNLSIREQSISMEFIRSPV